MNEILLLIEMLIVFSFILVSKKLFGKNRLFIWIAEKNGLMLENTRYYLMKLE